jgi:hypothetical protein
MRYFDNDMDELFNKAGKEYPLNTGKKDWSAVQKALASEEEAPAKAATGKNFKRFYPLLALLLLLPALFYVPDFFDENHNTPKNNISKYDPPKNDITDHNVAKDSISKQNNLNDNITGQNTSNPPASNAIPGKSVASENVTNKTIINKNIPSKNVTSKNITNKNLLTDNAAGETVAREKNLYKSLFLFELFNRNFAHPYSSVSEPLVKNTEPASATPPSAKKRPNKLYPAFYYGAMLGPDFSSIRSQDIKNIGSGLGLLLGYRFSEHWSVEASGYWSTKKYYTDGKYFNKANANIPAYVDLYFLDGGCQMVEVPIDIRYQFAPGRNSFFVTAGLNSYFMKKESYDYKAHASGSVYEGHRNYKNSGSNIFSNLQISGGYQHKLFSKFVVRIEPYLQVPLGEVGIGKMPITSAGVHFGLVRETK